MYANVKKASVLPIVLVLLISLLCVPVLAGAYCIICQEDNPAYCTGRDVSDWYTHYQHTFLGWGWGWECSYYLYQHWVATSCCNADVGNHRYETTYHSYCGKVEEAMACSEVPNWFN